MDIFTHACLRKPGPEMIHGLSQDFRGIPDLDIALIQHRNYEAALQSAGLTTVVCPADKTFPDGCFVEDTHLILPEAVVRLNPGAPSRRAEPSGLKEHLPQERPYLAVSDTHTIDGGDILSVGKKIYVGLSSRTQLQATQGLQTFLMPYGYSVIAVEVPDMLHLKSGVTALSDSVFLVLPSFAELPVIRAMGEFFVVPHEESSAANVISFNHYVLLPPRCPKTKAFVQNRFPEKKIIEVDTSEFGKLDGALTCLSLRW